jgi:hypothetical protein
MDYNIRELSNNDKDKWESFLLQSKQTLLFHSWKYKLLLERFLNLDSRYLCLFDDNDNIKSAIPLFYFKSQEGVIINSLPFYGSHGGVLEFDGNIKYKKAILSKYIEIINDQNVISATLISNTFDNCDSFINDNLSYDYIDERIGQIIHLPLNVSGNMLEDEIFKMCHYKTRNMIRKSMKSGFEFIVENSDESWDFLMKTHNENMLNINGSPKPDNFFYAIKDIFDPSLDYDIWVAKKGNVFCAAMLIFKYNKTVEYFTPVINVKYRNEQPLSGLIFNAMKDVVQKGFKFWNWGGTWLSQDGVYRFKSRWGTKDFPYFYYTKLKSKEILNLSKDEILSKFPYFYVLPFNELNNN